MKTVKLGAIILLLVKLLIVSSFAKNISYDDAKNVALNYVYSVTGVSVSVDESTHDSYAVETLEKNKAYHIIYLKPKGWVIVSADDVALPVIGYSTYSSLGDGHSLPPAFIDWMKNVDAEIKSAIKTQTDSNSTLDKNWERLMLYPEDFRQEAADSAGDTVTQVLLKTPDWNQNGFYNDMCPGSYNGEQTVVGCVATAMAEIMAYHRWPDKGTGSRTITKIDAWGNTKQYPNLYPLTVNFSGATYNWNNMSHSDMAKISYHAGVSNNMDYGYGIKGVDTGSSSSTQLAADALKKYFKYDVEGYKRKSDLGDTAWHNKLKAEFDQGRPVQYRGSGSEGGHSFVCEGYKYGSQKEYAFNWGWGGNSNGWFTLNSTKNPMGSLKNYQAAIFGIKPKGTTPPAPAPETPTLWASDGTYVGYIKVTWGWVANATKYVLRRDGVEIYSGPKYGEGTDTGLIPGKKYWYSIKACNSAGKCSAFAYDSGYRKSLAPPAKPTIWASDGTYDKSVKITFSWVSGATKYILRRDGRVIYSGGHKSAHWDTSAVPGKKYWYSIKACNSAGKCSAFAYDSGYRKGLTPVTPEWIQASDDNTNGIWVSAYWVSGATSYKIYRSYSSGGTKTLVATTSSTSYLDRAPSRGKTYYYWVKACNSSGCSGYSNYNAGYRK